MPEGKPRILFLDIETKPAKIVSFGIRDQHIQHTQIIEDGGTICTGMKWLGERKVEVLCEWDMGWHGMTKAVHERISEADAVCTFNGARFDLPRLMGDFLTAGLPPPPPVTGIDVFLTARKMGFISTKLAYVAPRLGLGSKLKHEGLQMWLDVMNGCEKAQRKMARYCAQDVRLLEDLYMRIRPYIANHPHMGKTDAKACGACGSVDIQHRGYRRTKASRFQRMHCQGCGSWSTGKRTAA